MRKERRKIAREGRKILGRGRSVGRGTGRAKGFGDRKEDQKTT